MHHTGHILMDETDQLIVAGGGEINGKGLSFHKRRSRNASRPVERGESSDGKPWATDLERQPYLTSSQKTHSVDLVNARRPCNTFACVNPYFIGKKSEGLMPHGMVLRSQSRFPLSVRHRGEG